MTFSMFKKLTAGLLVGDNLLPEDDEVVSELISYALKTVATQADSLHLMTLSTTDNILRLAQGDYLVRVPVAPAFDEDTIDIDEELIPAVARYVASMVSREKGGIHVNAADRLIKDYNAKTWEILEQMQLEAEQLGVADTCATPYDTTWSL